MIETIDNSVQFAATLVCCAISAALHFKRRSAEHFLLAAFYGCFALGLLYWTLYLVLFESTPGTFYVSTCSSLSKLILMSSSMIGSLNLMDFNHCPLAWRSG